MIMRCWYCGRRVEVHPDEKYCPVCSAGLLIPLDLEEDD